MSKRKYGKQEAGLKLTKDLEDLDILGDLPCSDQKSKPSGLKM